MKVPEAISQPSPRPPAAQSRLSAEHIMTFAFSPNYSRGKVSATAVWSFVCRYGCIYNLGGGKMSERFLFFFLQRPKCAGVFTWLGWLERCEWNETEQWERNWTEQDTETGWLHSGGDWKRPPSGAKAFHYSRRGIELQRFVDSWLPLPLWTS